MFRLERNIVLRIFGRLVVLIGIDAEEHEVSRMSWPHPVVCIGSKLSNGRWRRPYKADIFISIYDVGIIFIAVIHRFYDDFLVVFYFLSVFVKLNILVYFLF